MIQPRVLSLDELENVQETGRSLRKAAGLLKCDPKRLVEKCEGLVNRLDELQLRLDSEVTK